MTLAISKKPFLRRRHDDTTIAKGAHAAIAYWFDTKSHRFFKRYPTGQGVEVACGVSTRFHRLSLKSDWPRFSWSIIDLPSTIGDIRATIPSTDNFMLMTCTRPEVCWPEHVNWESATAKLIVLGEQSPLASAVCLNQASKHYQRARFGIDLCVLFKQREALQQLDRSVYSVVESRPVVDVLPNNSLMNTWWQRVRGNTAVLAHIRVIPQFSSAGECSLSCH